MPTFLLHARMSPQSMLDFLNHPAVEVTGGSIMQATPDGLFSYRKAAADEFWGFQVLSTWDNERPTLSITGCGIYLQDSCIQLQGTQDSDITVSGCNFMGTPPAGVPLLTILREIATMPRPITTRHFQSAVIRQQQEQRTTAERARTEAAAARGVERAQAALERAEAATSAEEIEQAERAVHQSPTGYFAAADTYTTTVHYNNPVSYFRTGEHAIRDTSTEVVRQTPGSGVDGYEVHTLTEPAYSETERTVFNTDTLRRMLDEMPVPSYNPWVDRIFIPGYAKLDPLLTPTPEVKEWDTWF